jgi:lactococcin 972 family bacteriocin
VGCLYCNSLKKIKNDESDDRLFEIEIGGIKMKKFIVLALSLFVLSTTGVVVNAGTWAYPSGGEWHYGVGATGSFSDYRHGSKDHSATVKNGNDYDKGEASAGHWAKARLFCFHGCEFFYNVW